MYNPLVILHENLVETEDKLGIVILYFTKISEFPFKHFLVTYEVGNLNIYLFRPLFCNKINFIISDISHIHRVSMEP